MSVSSIVYASESHMHYPLYCRDRSCAITLKRVPRPGGTRDQLVDEWIEYERPESERNASVDPKNVQDVPLRHAQVNDFVEFIC